MGSEPSPKPLAPPDLPLHTERLVLRTVQPGDRDAIGRYCALPEVTQYLPFPVLDADGLTRRMDRLVAARAPTAVGEILGLAVTLEDVLIGDLMVRFSASHEPDGQPAIAELGWVFSPDHAGMGYATEAARALIDLAFGHYPLHRLMAQLDPRNLASAALCERLGMRHEAHTREDYPARDGGWSDTSVYGLLRREWEALER